MKNDASERMRLRMLDWAMQKRLLSPSPSLPIVLVASIRVPGVIDWLGVDISSLGPLFKRQRRDGCEPFVVGTMPLSSSVGLSTDPQWRSNVAELAARGGIPVIVMDAEGMSLVTVPDASDPAELRLIEEVVDESGVDESGVGAVDRSSPAWRKLSARWQARNN